MIADRKLWLTADKSRLVEDGDRGAAFLFCTPGKRISEADAAKFGLIDDAEPADGTPEGEPAEKQADVPEDKQVTEAEDKSSGLTVNKRTRKTK